MATTAIVSGNVERFTFKVEGLAEELRVLNFSGDESISQPFNFELAVATEEGELSFADVIGKHALLSCYGADDIERYVNGIISRVEQLESGRRFTVYQLELVPQVALLGYRYNSRIFQNLTVQDIIQQVLNDAEIPSDQYGFVLQGTYEPREYCVQYRESDFNFISRLMEEEGIFYFFEHSEETHRLVIADSVSAHEEIMAPAQVLYRAPTTLLADQEQITQFRYSESIQSGIVVLRDFNFKKPALNLESQQQADIETELEVYDFPGEFQEPDRGDQLAGVRLEALRAAKKTGMGQSNCKRVVPGFRFTLTEHPRDEFNQEYLITSLTQSASQPQALEEGAGAGAGSYSNQFQCIPAAVPFRPVQRARKPLMEGVQTAIVVGPEGEEIYTDEHGRVKVQFHWDRLGENNENSSCWIRVSQVWAGANWGAMHIPRIGQEIIVNFIEGDPDRPIITGRVYHGTNRPPHPLPGSKTKSTVKSHTSPEDGTYNELLMEDKQGETQVVLSNAYGHKITEDEKTQSLTIETRDQHVVKLDDQNKKVSVTTTNGHSLVFDDTDTANEGTVTLNSTTGYKIELDDKNQKMTAQTKDGHIFTLDDENKKVELTTTNGHTAVFDDENEAIGITSSKGHYITIDDSADSITLEDSGGSHRFKIDIGGSTLVVSTDSGSINVEAPSGTIALKATNIEIEAQMDLKLNGLNVTSEAGVENKTSGTMVTTEASGINTVSGSLVKIN